MHFLHALVDGSLLGVFMISASTFAVLLFHPRFLGARVMPPLVRRLLMGLAMGATSMGLIYSPLGMYSGAHMNPSVTLAFAALGKVAAVDTVLYIAAQCVLGIVGMKVAHLILGEYLSHESVAFVTTRPGSRGPAAAARVEFAISFVLFFVVLLASNYLPTHRFTGALAGGLVATWITLFAPVSGMSMNPARTLASAVIARRYAFVWMYMVVPPLGMQAAAFAFDGLHRNVFCAKLCHASSAPCPFDCKFGELAGSCDSCDASRQQTDVAGNSPVDSLRRLRCP